MEGRSPAHADIRCSGRFGLPYATKSDLAKVLGFVRTYTHFALWRSVVFVIALLWASQFSTVHVVITWVVVGFISNLVNDVIFYRMQNVVHLTGAKILLIGTSWVWAAIVIAIALA